MKKWFVVACKQINRKISDPRITQSFIRKKNTKPVKQSEIVTYRPKIFENLNIVDIKSNCWYKINYYRKLDRNYPRL